MTHKDVPKKQKIKYFYFKNKNFLYFLKYKKITPYKNNLK